MSVRIRLSRGGSKKRPFYKIVVADKRAPRDGRFIEKVGTYNPLLPKEHEGRLTIVPERIKEWISKGAEITDRVARLLSEKGVVAKPAIPANQTKKPNPKAKAVERMKAKAEAEKAKAEAEAAAKAEAEAKVAEEAAAAKAAEEAAAAEPAAAEEPAPAAEEPAAEAAAEEAPAPETPAE